MSFWDGVTVLVEKERETDISYLDLCKALDAAHVTPLSPDWRDWIWWMDNSGR